MKLPVSVLLAALAATAGAQVYIPDKPGPAGSPAPAAPSSSPLSQGNNTTIINKEEKEDKPLPFFDPGSETLSMEGKLWNVTNNRALRARFEKYLATPEANTMEDSEYRATLDGILKELAPGRSGGPDLPKAVALLPKAAQFPIDARLCDALVNAIYSVWISKKNIVALDRTNTELEAQAKIMRHNIDVTVGKSGQQLGDTRKTGSDKEGKGGKSNVIVPSGDEKMPGIVDGYVKKSLELQTRRAANLAKMEIGEIETKVQFQSLILQFLAQRRFEHVIMASRFYRVLFTDGDTALKIQKGSDAEKTFNESLGFSPTLSTFDAAANEAIREVDEGIEAFKFLASQQKLESASKRLMEIFMLGEYMPKVRTLPRSEKEKVTDFVHDSNELLSAIEVKDYTRAETLIAKLKTTAKDFDDTKASQVIAATKAVSNQLLGAAVKAAADQNQPLVQENLEKATKLWPTNPKLATVTDELFRRGDVQGQALNEFDSLLAQKNFRQIFDNQGRYIAASVGKPAYEEKVKAVLKDMGRVTMVLAQSSKLAETGDKYGAWEVVEQIASEFPTDNEINAKRANLSSQVADLAQALSRAGEREKIHQTGSSLAWFLKARKIYPRSDLARQGIERLVNQILPEGATAAAESTPAAPGS